MGQAREALSLMDNRSSTEAEQASGCSVSTVSGWRRRGAPSVLLGGEPASRGHFSLPMY